MQSIRPLRFIEYRQQRVSTEIRTRLNKESSNIRIISKILIFFIDTLKYILR